MSSNRVVLTIRAMAEMGPWVLQQIDVLDGRVEQCQRCSTWIKNVWVMEKQTEPKETRRIGSECGPKLEAMSEELWEIGAQPFKRSLRHLSTLERLVDLEQRLPHMAPESYVLGWAAEQRLALARGLTPHQRLVMGSQVNRAWEAWSASIRRRAAPPQASRVRRRASTR